MIKDKLEEQEVLVIKEQKYNICLLLHMVRLVYRENQGQLENVEEQEMQDLL